MSNQLSVQTKNVRNSALSSVYGKAVVLTGAALPLFAHAELDMAAAETQLGLGLAAVGALGAAKLAPAALSWVWSLVTRVAQR